MENLRLLEERLKQLHEDFNQQVVSLNSDTKEFHNSLIELSSKYPEHKELIQFIVFVNDKIETNQAVFSEIIIEAFNDLVSSKRELLRQMMETQGVKVKPSSFWSKIKDFKDLKIIIIGIAVIVISAGIMLDPAFLGKLLSAIGVLKG